jgi:hypothetical protein
LIDRGSYNSPPSGNSTKPLTAFSKKNRNAHLLAFSP